MCLPKKCLRMCSSSRPAGGLLYLWGVRLFSMYLKYKWIKRTKHPHTRVHVGWHTLMILLCTMMYIHGIIPSPDSSPKWQWSRNRNNALPAHAYLTPSMTSIVPECWWKYSSHTMFPPCSSSHRRWWRPPLLCRWCSRRTPEWHWKQSKALHGHQSRLTRGLERLQGDWSYPWSIVIISIIVVVTKPLSNLSFLFITVSIVVIIDISDNNLSNYGSSPI